MTSEGAIMCSGLQKLTLDDIKKGANEPGDCGNAPNVTPPWLDVSKFRRGQEFFVNNIMSITTSMHFSLVPGFVLVNLLEPLVFTNNSHEPEKAFKRYVQTFYHVLKWCTDPDIWNEKKNSPAFRSTQIVRKMHRSVAAAMDKKRADDKVYISQYDMALVQSGFMGAIVMYPTKFGVACTEKELEDYVHLWRGLGYLLGIDDKYNLCCGNYKDTYDLVKEIEQKLLVPAFRDPAKDFDKMAHAYIDGLNLEAGYNAHSVTSMMALAYDGIGLELGALSLADMFRFYWFKIMMFAVRYVPGVKRFFNYKAISSIDQLMERLFGKGADFFKNYYNF